MVRFEVIDQGPGVPEEHLDRIFEPLFTTKTRGFGLGLPLSRTLAQANGGRLDVGRAEPGGAVFVLQVPIAAASREVEPADGLAFAESGEEG